MVFGNLFLLILQIRFDLLLIVAKTYHIKFGSVSKISKEELDLKGGKLYVLDVLQKKCKIQIFVLHNIYLVKLHSIRKEIMLTGKNVQLFVSIESTVQYI